MELNALKKNGKFSIVVPLYECADYVAKTIESVQHQKAVDLQIVVIDDGSTDDGPAIVRAMQKKDSRIQIHSQKNAGLSAARNVGVKYTTGRYLYFLDSDDWIEPGTLQAVAEAFDAGNPDIVLFHATVHDATTQTIYPFYDSWIWDQLDGQRSMARDSENFPLLLQIEPAMQIRVFDRSFYVEQGFRFAEGQHFEDFAIHVSSILRANSIGLINRRLFNYRVGRPGQITQQKSNKRFDILKSYQQTLPIVKETRLASRAMSHALGVSYVRAMFRLITWCSKYVPRESVTDFNQQLIQIVNQTPRDWIEGSLRETDTSIERVLYMLSLVRKRLLASNRVSLGLPPGLRSVLDLSQIVGYRATAKYYVPQLTKKFSGS